MKHINYILVLCALLSLLGCSRYQPVKDVWKSTKGMWYTYVSQPASVDYETKADLPDQAKTLSRDMRGVDVELGKLERVMQNADRPPTQEWLDQLFAQFPWINGFAGIKYDGTILGQQPPDSMKDLDFNPLLYEDKKQSSRALRTDIQPSPLGPEIMLATPLYDGTDFLGIVAAYFDMRSIMHFSQNPQDIVILAPNALLWPGKYDFAATPLAGVDWPKVVQESSAGVCSNSTGSFIYIVRYLGNLPLIFAIPEKGDFPEGDGGIEQGFAYFPPEREKTPPPDLPERKNKVQDVPFAQPAEGELAETQAPDGAEGSEQAAREDGRPSPGEIQPGSPDSVLLKGGGKRGGGRVQERPLEGENVEVERVERPRAPLRRVPIIIPEEPEETPQPAPVITRPSPFGPRPDAEEAAPTPEERPYTRPSPFGPRPDSEERTPAAEPSAKTAPESATSPDAAPAPALEAAPASEDIPSDEPLADGEPASED